MTLIRKRSGKTVAMFRDRAELNHEIYLDLMDFYGEDHPEDLALAMEQQRFPEEESDENDLVRLL